MKKTYLGIICSFLIGVVGVCTAEQITLGQKQFETVKEAQIFIENFLDISAVEIDDPLPYALIYSVLEQGFDANVYQTQVDQIKTLWTNGIPPRNLQREMTKKFLALKNLIVAISPQKTEKLFAQQKYLLYQLLEYTQNLSTNGDLSPSPTIEQTPLEHASAEAPISTTIEDSSSYLQLLNKNQSLTLQKDILLSQLTEKILQQEIGILLQKGILDQYDINLLNDKIEISYVEGCGTTKGSYHMLQKVDGSNRKLKAIKLNINLCMDTHYINNFDRYVRQIFIHELAHYLYYFKDSSYQTFNVICWGNDINTCQKADFVSEYAQKNKEEDYAESFTYWYLGYLNEKEHGSAHESTEVQQKYRYFSSVYRFKD